MIVRRRAALRLAGALLAAAVATSAGATMHRPLPAGSTERNGTPQTMQRHVIGLPHTPGAPAPVRLPPGVPRTYSGEPISVKTWRYDAGRTGWNDRETDLTPTSVASPQFGQIASLPVAGLVLAQPLIVAGFPMPDGKTHDVLVVATSHDVVYAFDAVSYALLWSVKLGHPQSASDVGCGDVAEYGVSSTPTIARPSPDQATIYLVAATEPAPFLFHHQLHALDLRNGADIVAPVEIAPSAPLPGGGSVSFDPQNQYNRAGLAFRGSSIYVGLGSHCDNNAGGISGWLLRYNTGLNLVDAFPTIQAKANYELSAIWMSGAAPAFDAADNVFFATGNGYFSENAGALGFGESVVSLTAELAVRSTFTPSDWAQLNSGDLDFGSGGVVLLPPVAGQAAPPLAAAIGKEAKLYLLDQDSLGGLKTNDAGALWRRSLGPAGGGLWGAPAYYADATGGLLYVQVDSDVLRAFRVAATAKPTLTQVAAGTSNAGFGGSTPIVSSDGAVAGTAVVWLVRRGTNLALEAYDAEKLGAPIFSAAAGTWPGSNALLTPMEANGRVYVGADKTVKVFGLSQ